MPPVADISSRLLSRPVEVARYGLIRADAQKNRGIAGLTVLIVRDDPIGQALLGCGQRRPLPVGHPTASHSAGNAARGSATAVG